MTAVHDHHHDLARVLRPVAPPRILEGVYTDDEHDRLLGVVQQHGPWPSIIAHHFTTVDEMIATVTGVVPEGHGLTLDDVAGAHFRGFYGQNSVCFFPEVHDIFYARRFLDEVKSYWDVPYAKPTLMLFNICGPHDTGLDPHLDAVSFRGITIDNTPVWIQNCMGKSGLFTGHLVKMAQVITWWYRGAHGTFTYWPDGPLEPPKVLDHPLWNKGVVVQNELMFHRGDPVGRPEERNIPGLKHRSRWSHDPGSGSGDDSWVITTDGEVVRRYQPHEIRFLVHWSAELYADMDECKRVMDHKDDLTHDQVIDTFVQDLRSRGRSVPSVGADPFHDPEFIRALMETYTIAPTTDWLR